MKMTRAPSKSLSAMGVAVKIAVGVRLGGGWVEVGEGISVAVGSTIVLVGDAGAGDRVGAAVSGSWVWDGVMGARVADGDKALLSGEQAARQVNPAKIKEKNLR
jgi:hypothetical protein